MLEKCKQLEDKIQQSYQEGVTVEEAERLAGEFLHAQLMVAEELRKSDLDARMRKSGVKSIKAAVYLEEASKGDKKPSDVYLQAKVDSSSIVTSEHKSLDEAEVSRDLLQNYFNIFKESHIHFRSIAKGSFGS